MAAGAVLRVALVLFVAMALRVVLSSWVNQGQDSRDPLFLGLEWLHGSGLVEYGDFMSMRGGGGVNKFSLADVPTIFSFSTSGTGKVHWIEALTLMFLPGSQFEAVQTGPDGAPNGVKVSFMRRDMGQASGNGYVHPMLLDFLRLVGFLGSTGEAGDVTALVVAAEATLAFFLPLCISLCLLYYTYGRGLPQDYTHPESAKQEERTRAMATVPAAISAQIQKINRVAANSINLPTVLTLLWFLNPIFLLQAASLDLLVVEQTIVVFAFVLLVKGTTRSTPNASHHAVLLPKPYGQVDDDDLGPTSTRRKKSQEAGAVRGPMQDLETVASKLPTDKREEGSDVALILAVILMLVLAVLHPPRLAMLVGVAIVADKTSRTVILVTLVLVLGISISTSAKLLSDLADSSPIWGYLVSLGSAYKAQLLLENGYPMGEPNLSIQWYFFQTMFVEYSRLYCFAFRMFPLLLTVGIAIKIKNQIFPTKREVVSETKRVAKLERAANQKKQQEQQQKEGQGGNQDNGGEDEKEKGEDKEEEEKKKAKPAPLQPKQYPDMDISAPISIFILSNLLVIMCKPMTTLPEMCFALLLCVIGAFPLMHGAGIQMRRLHWLTASTNAQGRDSDEATAEALSQQLKTRAEDRRGEGMTGTAPLLAGFFGMIPVTHAFYYAWLVQQVANPNFLFFSCAVLQAVMWQFFIELTRAVMKQSR